MPNETDYKLTEEDVKLFADIYGVEFTEKEKNALVGKAPEEIPGHDLEAVLRGNKA